MLFLTSPVAVPGPLPLKTLISVLIIPEIVLPLTLNVSVEVEARDTWIPWLPWLGEPAVIVFPENVTARVEESPESADRAIVRLPWNVEFWTVPVRLPVVFVCRKRPLLPDPELLSLMVQLLKVTVPVVDVLCTRTLSSVEPLTSARVT